MSFRITARNPFQGNSSGDSRHLFYGANPPKKSAARPQASSQYIRPLESDTFTARFSATTTGGGTTPTQGSARQGRYGTQSGTTSTGGSTTLRANGGQGGGPSAYTGSAGTLRDNSEVQTTRPYTGFTQMQGTRATDAPPPTQPIDGRRVGPFNPSQIYV